MSGQRGSGKSYWTKKHLAQLPRVLIYDSLSEYTADYEFQDIESLVDFLQTDQANGVFYSASLDTFDESDFPLFCRAALACQDLYVVIEEIDLFTNPLSTPVELLRLLKYGRHWNLQIIGVSRRPAEVSRHFTAMTTRFVIFNQREPRDIAYFRSIIGEHADKIPLLTNNQFLDIDFKNPSYNINNRV